MHTRHLVAALALTAGLHAQTDFDLEKLTAGTLGSNLVLTVANAPANGLGLMAVSFTGGPSPIAAFDPLDPRSLQVGTELASAWRLLLLDGQGSGGVALTLPANPAFSNLVWHWQALTLTAAGPRLVGPISNAVVTQTSVAGRGQLAPGSLAVARGFAASFFDRNNNAGMGDVVIAGGGAGSLTSATGLQSTEVWDFRGMRRRPGANMTTSRALHLAVTLADGRVLLIGGSDTTGAVLASCEIYDPTTNAYTATGSMATPRTLHAACLLADGRVMVAGGTSSLVDTTAAITSTLGSVEIYNPVTGTWSNGPSLGGRRLAPALTRLPNNQIMVSGGVEVGFLFGLPISAVSTTAVQRWSPTSNSWTNGPNMSQGRAGHHYNQVTLDDGRVLLTGGTLVPNLLGAANATPITGAESYNPATNTWTTHNMPTARALHTATKLPDGRVLVCGGAQGTLTTPVSIDNVEIFQPASNTWTVLPSLTGPRSAHAAALLPDGTVALFGGQGATATIASVETLRF